MESELSVKRVRPGVEQVGWYQSLLLAFSVALGKLLRLSEL